MVDHVTGLFIARFVHYLNSSFIVFPASICKLATFAHQDIFSEDNTNKLLKRRNSTYSLRGSNKLVTSHLLLTYSESQSHIEHRHCGTI